MSIQLVNNVPNITKDFEDLSKKARFVLSSQILADANRHARMDTGMLIMSSQRASNLQKGELVWDTPYAKRVYYTGTPSTDVNPDAQLMWLHFARDRYKDNWRIIYRKVYEKYT